jgi:hypothetical protein
MINSNDLIKNIEKLHTTKLGINRIRNNMNLNSNDVVTWCKERIKQSDDIYKKGKNWYVIGQKWIITINASSYTIITAHKK